MQKSDLSTLTFKHIRFWSLVFDTNSNTGIFFLFNPAQINRLRRNTNSTSHLYFSFMRMYQTYYIYIFFLLERQIIQSGGETERENHLSTDLLPKRPQRLELWDPGACNARTSAARLPCRAPNLLLILLRYSRFFAPR